ncbi:MAG: B12-binding domain-containing radical SAM protein [Acidobacteriota bacterium]
MRILLVYANRSKLLLPAPPIGLAHVAEATRAAGYDVRLLDLFGRSAGNGLRRALSEWHPDVVGVSVRNLDTTIAQRPASHLDEVASLFAAIRRKSRAYLVVGGPAVTILGARALAHLPADAAVLGEGEEAFPALLAALGSGRDPGLVPGVATSPTARPTPPERLPSFGRSHLERWIDWRAYERAGSTWPIQTRRGCPLGCVHCVYAAVEGCAVRARSAGEVVEEIAEVAAAVGPRCFEFVDSSFNVPPEPALELCEAIVRRGLRVALTCSSVNPATLSPELLALMRRAGFNSMMLSPESASDEVLAALGKGFSAMDVARAADAARSAAMPSGWFFMLGGPGETERSADETMSFIERKLDWPGTLVIVTTGIRVLPGSALAPRAVAEGTLDPADDLARPTFYLSPRVTQEALLARVNAAVDRRPNVVHAAEQDSVTERAVARALAASGVAPPAWRFLPAVLRWRPLRAWRRREARRRPFSTLQAH